MFTQKIARRRLIYVSSLFAVALLTSTSVQADLEAEIDIREFARSADFIFKGTIANVEYRNSEAVPLLDPNTGAPLFDPNGDPLYEDGSNIPHTFVTYQIDEIYKGRAPQAFPGGPPDSNVTLRFMSGQSQTDTSEYLLVSSYPLFDVNDRDILFVKGNTTTSCPLYQLARGRFRILNDPNDPNARIINKMYTEYGEEILFVPGGDAGPNDVAVGPYHSLVETDTHDMGEFILKKVSVDDGNEFDLPGANDVPEVGVPKGEQFTEAQFDTYLAQIVREVCGTVPPEDCGIVAVSADVNQPFTAIPIPVAEPNIMIPEEITYSRPWLDRLPPDEKAAILEAERVEAELFKLTGGDPVLPQTPCEVSILTYGAIPGDVSGPQGKPDCRVNLFDLVVTANNWLKAVEPAFSLWPLCLE